MSDEDLPVPKDLVERLQNGVTLEYTPMCPIGNNCHYGDFNSDPCCRQDYENCQHYRKAVDVHIEQVGDVFTSIARIQPVKKYVRREK